MQAYDRKAQRLIETAEPGGASVRFLYGNPLGRQLLKAITGKRFSDSRAKYYASPRSQKKVAAFFREYPQACEGLRATDYPSFRDFFIREPDPADRPLPEEEGALVAVADSKLLVYTIAPGTVLPVKQSNLTAGQLLGDRTYAALFAGGYALVFRLTMENNHHYVFPDSGTVLREYEIRGKLHSVQPITGRQGKVFTENTRQVSLLDTAHLGLVAQAEVGALLAGRMVSHGKREFRRGEEKGYFDLGGSAIVLLVQKGRVAIDEDILGQSAQGIETLVRMNERVGVAI